MEALNREENERMREREIEKSFSHARTTRQILESEADKKTDGQMNDYECNSSGLIRSSCHVFVSMLICPPSECGGFGTEI